MFRDLKEYQEIAKIYAEKVSKPENLEERRGSSPEQLAQNRKNAFKPVTPPQRGAGGGVGNPTNVRGSGAKPRPKPEVKKLPSTAEIRAANPNVVPGTRVNEIGAKGGGKPSSGDLSMFKDKEPKVSTMTSQGKPRTKAQMMAAKRIASGKTIADVKAANTASMKSRAAERNQKFQDAKKSGNLAQFRKDNPKMSGADRAKAMAKARLAAKNKPVSGGGASATKKIDGAGLASKMSAEKSASSSGSNTVPSGSFGISAKGKEQAEKNKAEVANKKTSGSVKTVNVGGKDVDLSKVGPGMKKRLMQKNVGTNAAKEVEKVNPKPGQTVNVKQDPKTGSVSSTKKITQGTGGGTEGLTKSAGSLEANKKKAEKLKQEAAKRAAMEKEFEIPESKQYDAYDLVLDYLLSSEQVATIEEANYVMTEMDAETIQGIVEEQKKTLDEMDMMKMPVVNVLGGVGSAIAGTVAAAKYLGRKAGEKSIKKTEPKKPGLIKTIKDRTDATNKAIKEMP